jgi:hypothetical protein
MGMLIAVGIVVATLGTVDFCQNLFDWNEEYLSEHRGSANACLQGLTTEQRNKFLQEALTMKKDEHFSMALQDMQPIDIDPNVVSAAGMSNNALALDQLLDKAPELVDRKDSYGRTPLQTATLASARDAVEIILEHKPTKGIEEAIVSAFSRSLDIGKLLSRYRPDWVKDPYTSARAIAAAARYTDLSTVEYLVDIGVDPALKTEFGSSVAFAAPHNRDQTAGEKIWDFLVARGAPVADDICGLDKQSVTNIEKNAPEWFEKSVHVIRSTCD